MLLLELFHFLFVFLDLLCNRWVLVGRPIIEALSLVLEHAWLGLGPVPVLQIFEHLILSLDIILQLLHFVAQSLNFAQELGLALLQVIIVLLHGLERILGLALRLCLLLELAVLLSQCLELLSMFLLVSVKRFLLLLEILNQISFAIGLFFELLVLSLQVLHEL